MADLLDLYNECRRRGLNVRGLSGWSSWQNGYWFRGERFSGSGSQSTPPSAFINHHTATSAYTPNVKNSSNQSKANIWLGLDRGNTGSGRMYSTGSGVARADFAVRWAANYGNGACDRSVYEQYVWRDRVAPNQPSGSDDGYANKIAIGMEIIHPGDGSILDPGVWELAAQINAAAMHVFGWDIARILDHRSSTRRKVDVNFKQKRDGYTINALRHRIVEITAGTPPVEPPDPGEDEIMLRKGDSGDVVAHYQGRANAWRSTNPLVVDGNFGSATEAKILSFQKTEKFPERMWTGEIDGVTAARLDSYAEDLVDAKLRRDLGTIQQQHISDLRAHEGTPHGGDGDGTLPDHTHVAGGVAT